jgi:hypothetical protein
VDLTSSYDSGAEALRSALQHLGFVLQCDDLAGPVYVHKDWPKASVRIAIRHKTQNTTALILRQEPLSLHDVEEASLQLGILATTVRREVETRALRSSVDN